MYDAAGLVRAVRLVHLQVGSADDNTDEEQAFTEFSNLEKQTKIVDEVCANTGCTSTVLV